MWTRGERRDIIGNVNPPRSGHPEVHRGGAHRGARERISKGPSPRWPWLGPLHARWEKLESLVLTVPGARRTFRALSLLVGGFRGEAISLRASALTYLSLIALVPLLAVVYAVLDLAGDEAPLRASVERWVTEQLGISAGAALDSRIEQLTSNASVKTLGVIGFAFLLVSIVSLLWNIESAFNHIFGVKRPRKLLDRLLKYWSFITLGPVLLAGSLGLTWRLSQLQTIHAAHSQPGHSEILHVLTELSAVAITYAALTLLYKVLPNARVPLRSAVTAGFVAGTAWEFAKFIFAFASARMVHVHMIYGSLAVLPITLMWIYISWVITLGGCRLCFALEASRKSEPLPFLQGAAAREALTARAALELVRLHRDRGMPVKASWIARELDVTRRLAVECLRALQDAGLVAETRAHRWLPARDARTISLAEVRLAARQSMGYPHIETDPLAEPLVHAWEKADLAASIALRQSLGEFLEAHDPRAVHDPAAAVDSVLPPIADERLPSVPPRPPRAPSRA